MAQWQCKGDDGWVDFDKASCATLSTAVGATKLVIGDRIYAIDAERQFQTNEVTGYRRAIRCLADCVVASEGAPMLQQPGPRQHPGVGAWEFQVFARGPWTAYEESVNARIQTAHGRGDGSLVVTRSADGGRHKVDFGSRTATKMKTGKVFAIRRSHHGVPMDETPGAAVPESTAVFQRRVHDIVRAGSNISEAEARAYSRTLTVEQYTGQNAALLGLHSSGNGCCVYNMFCGGCLWSVPPFALPLPCLWFLGCSLLREAPDNRFVHYGGDGCTRETQEMHSCAIVDHERGTFACFKPHPCGACCKPEGGWAAQSCYCKKAHRTPKATTTTARATSPPGSRLSALGPEGVVVQPS